jgi:acetolactate synthase-1/2/3 large subunit
MPNLQELETIRRLGLPIKILVINNNGYGSIRVSQQRWFDRTIAADSNSGMTFPDLRKISCSYDINYHYADNEASLLECFRKALNTTTPEIIDIQVPPEEDRIPRLGNYKREDGMMASRPLEDMFPFLDRSEFEQNMIIPTIS